jgi:hypothetical protein
MIGTSGVGVEPPVVTPAGVFGETEFVPLDGDWYGFFEE